MICKLTSRSSLYVNCGASSFSGLASGGTVISQPATASNVHGMHAANTIIATQRFIAALAFPTVDSGCFLCTISRKWNTIA